MSAVPTPWIQLPAVDPQEVESAKALMDAASDYVIDSPELRALADRELVEMKRRLKKLEEVRKGITGPLDQAKKAVMALFRVPEDHCETGIQIITGKIIGYDNKLAAERAEQQRAANEAAAQQRATLEAAGITEAAALVQAPVIKLTVDKSEQSTQHRTTWSAEVTDLMALVKAVAEGRASIKCLQADLPYLNGLARLEREALKIDGVQAVASTSLTARREAA